MYFVKYGKEYLHDPRKKDSILFDLSLTGKENSCGFCDFTIYPNHPMYNKLKEHDSWSPIKVYDDDELLFSGFIYELGKDFQLDGQVKCKGDLAYLSESIVRPYSTLKRGYGQQAPTNPAEYFKWLIDQHNSQMDASKQFTVGINQALLLDNNGYIYRENDSYPNTLDEINEKLLKNTGLGGVLRIRYDGDVRYIDYLVEWTSSNTTQKLEFGENLTDYSQTDDSEELYTFVVPIGAKMNETKYDYNDGYFVTSDTAPVSGKEYFTKDTEPHKYHGCGNLTAFEQEETYYEYNETNDESNMNLTLIGLSDGTYDGTEYKKIGDKVYNEEAVSKYGWIGCVYKDTDIIERSNLVNKAIAYLKTAISPKRTIEIKAVDLHLLNPDIKPIRIGEYIRVVSKPHGLDSYFLCAEIDLNLNNPESSKYTLGMVYDTLTGQQNKQIVKLNATINETAEAANKLSEDVKMTAKKAAETAEEAKQMVNSVDDKANTAVNKAEEAISKTEKTEATIKQINQASKDAVNNAQAAIEAASKAEAAANAVASQMSSVNTKIDEAKTAADNANSLAESANQAATAAETSAENAVTTANAAKAEAEKAKTDIASLGESLETLTQTVETDYAKKTELTEIESTLTTSISQNAAAIESHAQQITTISTDVNTAKDDAAQAKSIADDAAIVAETAQSAAADAALKVTEAQTAADNAQAKADEAKTAADAAQLKADAAEKDLATAKTNLENLQKQADATDEDLAKAQAAVEAAQSAADTAKIAADDAKSAADAAQTTASNAATEANNAKTTADNAKTAADKAKLNAQEAKEAAEAAQEAADSLGTRMTTAETAIQENAEEIALKASKEEVNKANNEIRDSLKKYASIDVVSTQISGVVEEITETESELQKLAAQVELNKQGLEVTVKEERANALEENLANTATRVENIEKYVRIDANGVTVGDKSYPYVARVTPNAFQIGTIIDDVFVPVSYLTEDTLSNRNVEIANALTIGKTNSDTNGHYEWHQELDGTLSLIYKA